MTLRLLTLILGLTLLASASPVRADLRTDLRNAALKGDLPRVQKLLKSKPGFIKTKQATGILGMAAYSGNKALVLYLIGQGSKVTERDSDGSTPLYHAANGGSKPVVELLLARGAKVKDARKDGWTPLHAAVASGERPLVELLLARGADPNAKSARGETPFAIAVKYRYDDIAALLQKRTKAPKK